MPALHQIIFVQPAIVVAARATGALTRHWIELRTTFTKSSIQQRDGLTTGEYDLAITAMDNAISWTRDTGMAFRVVAQIERHTRLEVFGRRGIEQLQDLRGARLGVDALDSGFVLVLRGALEAAGLTPAEYSLVACGGVKERFDALLEGAADAALLGPPLTTMAMAAGLPRLSTIEQLFPDYPGLGVVIRRDRLAELRPALSAYLEVLKESLDWMKQHPRDLSDALLAANFPSNSIQDVLGTRPDTLRPDSRGIERILDLRRRYDSRFDQTVNYHDLVDAVLVDG